MILNIYLFESLLSLYIEINLLVSFFLTELRVI